MGEFDELEAMKKIAAALEPLEEGARGRALNWAFSKYRGALRPSEPIVKPDRSEGTVHQSSTFQTFAELFDAVQPTTEKDKALVAAYWMQVVRNTDSFQAQALNDELKNLGYGVANITDALTQLKNDRPALALQLKKSGTSKQARKVYKLTLEGIKRLESMVLLGRTENDRP